MNFSLYARLLAACFVAVAALPAPAAAQSTDGFHAIQVIPIVVDSGSFRTRLTFTNPSSSARTVRVYYIPGEGTPQASELDCGTFTMAAGAGKTFESLREVCSSLAAGSQFGTLHTMIAAPVPALALISYSAYARVENPQGIGFSVEAFPAHTITGGQKMVAGLRRRAATPSSPAIQSNCFIGALHREQAGPPADASLEYELVGEDGQFVGAGEIALSPGKLVRVLDIFAHAGAAAGDHDKVSMYYYQGEGAVVAFCTLQDNTSFSADFRIAKQFVGQSVAQNGASSPFAQDDHVMRRTTTSSNVRLTDGAGSTASQAFVIPVSGAGNAHLLQLRNPDWISCSLEAPVSGMPLNNLEMRLLYAGYPLSGGAVIAGGDGVSSFGAVYLGDKGAYEANGRYVLEVEGKEPAAPSDIAYQIRCYSGSGHSIPDLVRSGGPNQF